jgi:Flp pilus assembly protein protease CpaA
MKVNADIRVSINSGTALLLFILCFFALLLMEKQYPAVERVFAVALIGLTGAFSGYLVKRNLNNKIDLEAVKLKAQDKT